MGEGRSVPGGSSGSRFQILVPEFLPLAGKFKVLFVPSSRPSNPKTPLDPNLPRRSPLHCTAAAWRQPASPSSLQILNPLRPPPRRRWSLLLSAAAAWRHSVAVSHRWRPSTGSHRRRPWTQRASTTPSSAVVGGGRGRQFRVNTRRIAPLALGYIVTGWSAVHTPRHPCSPPPPPPPPPLCPQVPCPTLLCRPARRTRRVSPPSRSTTTCMRVYRP